MIERVAVNIERIRTNYERLAELMSETRMALTSFP